MLHIRHERPEDYSAVCELLVAAFAHHPHSQQNEHRIVESLRTDKALAVALVAEENGEVRGHIAFSAVRLGSDDKGWYCLGPVAVAPPFQRYGIGSALINHGMDILREQGARGVILVGSPDYYGRFGFVTWPEISVPGIPQQFVLARCFGDRRPLGEVIFHPAFGV